MPDTSDSPVVDITQLPTVDESRVTQVFNELENMDVPLDADPLQYGPKRLNGKVAKARSMLSRCERIYLQVTHDLQSYKSAHRLAETLFDLQIQDLMATDRETVSGKNVQTQLAIATTKLRKEKELINKLEICIGDLVMVLGVVKAKRADLKDIQSRLRDQLKLCAEEISLGSGWGSKPPPGITGPDLSKAPITNKRTLDQIQDLVDEGAEVDLGAEDVAEWTEHSEGGKSALDEAHLNSASVDALLDALVEVEAEPDPLTGGQEEDPDKAILDMEALLKETAAEMAATTRANVDEVDLDALILEVAHGVEAGEAEAGEAEAGEAEVEEAEVEEAEVEEAEAGEAEAGEAEAGEAEVEEATAPTDEQETNLGGLFDPEAEAEEAKPSEEALVASTTDEEVDDIFRQLDVQAPKVKKAALVAEDNLDDLIGMFSQ